MDKIYYFSGTGNSYHVAKKISENLGIEIENIAELIEKDTIFSGEIIGIVFPVYYMGIPQMVGKFLTKLKVEGNPYIFAIGTCGGTGYGIPFSLVDSILKDKKTEKNEPLKLSYSSYLQMPDGYLKFFTMRTKEVAIEMIKKSDEKLELQIEEINERKIVNWKPTLLTPIFKLIYSYWLGYLKKADKGFRVKENCIGCNLCMEICPAKNIQMKESRPTWNGKCQDCMGCINMCPVAAIEYGTKTEKRGRYFNPYVKKDEMKIK